MMKKGASSTSAENEDMRQMLIAAAVDLLNSDGPEAVQIRKVATAARTSTMAVYKHFGGMPGLVNAVAEESLRRFGAAQAAPAQTDDPVADFMVTGLAYRQFALDNPHMCRLMFGVTSADGINAPRRNMFDTTVTTPMHPSAEYLFRCVQRCMAEGRIDGSPDDLSAVLLAAAKFWTMIHGFVMLELAGFWGTKDHAAWVLASLTTDLFVALGDSHDKVYGSAASTLSRAATELDTARTATDAR
ncbi:DNA-binding transcriptional regulator EnvR [Mycobacteroides salmoniphilum]|nr:DNA-binding transcriptional regulator EnvR [Mycobacteroides salmoniphilum]